MQTIQLKIPEIPGWKSTFMPQKFPVRKYAEIGTSFMRLFSFPEMVENVVWLASGNFQKGIQEYLVEWKAPFIPLVIDCKEHLSFTNL